MAKTPQSKKSDKRRGPGPVAWTFMGIGAGAVAGSVTAGVYGGLASLFAREVVTPAGEPEENVEVLHVDETTDAMTITLQLTPDTVVPGVYSFWFDADRGHARLGDIVERDRSSVTRQVLSVDRGDLTAARSGRMGGSVYLSPGDLGLEYQDVEVPVSAGRAPAWLIPGTTRADTWAIMIHGRGAQRIETLRGVPSAHEAGMTTLCVSYRNDGEAPDVNNGKYGLGATEWRDVDSAIRYAIDHGARDVVLFGWSMGGSIALQVANLSQHRTRVLGLVLDGPAVNWFDILDHQAKINHVPYVSGRLGTWLLTHPLGKRIAGLTAPIDLRSLDWVARADELRIPTLILHSEDDDFVPYSSSARLAEKNPTAVTLKTFHTAGHVGEWNIDPDRWRRVTGEWLDGIL